MARRPSSHSGYGPGDEGGERADRDLQRGQQRTGGEIAGDADDAEGGAPSRALSTRTSQPGRRPTNEPERGARAGSPAPAPAGRGPARR
ncbi:hypothetical protein STVIR_3027 [Streptomyces viridochromogenes Tue57]|uniref:Uncharacterized protein n=1 Tax=Streptomyces viridochromogenes Tue57 TaxID=1160705 RepID=L8PKV1_STRVR|nr:hypothetical protein STVIR_3027 [Streptomyces viridochromogenes Tue57]